MLQSTFNGLVARYTNDQKLCNELWHEIELQYKHPKRHYHTLTHLTNLLSVLQPVQDRIKHWDAVLFALFYHDVVYKVTRSDNEEKSAVFAAVRMQALPVPADMIESCCIKIRATQYHTQDLDADTDYFTDADLAIFGEPWEVYKTYCSNIRKEYAVYPDILYKPGRKKILQHFLQMERIYKTDWFAHKLETQARQNIQQELAALS